MHSLIFNTKTLEGLNIEELQNALKANDVDAMFNVGMMYHQGIQTKENPEKALKWLAKAAMHNHKNAAYNLGIIYLCGLDTPCNIKKGRDYLEMAAKNGAEVAALIRRIDSRYRATSYRDEEFDIDLLNEHYNRQVIDKVVPKRIDIALIISIVLIITGFIIFINYMGRLDFLNAALGILIGGGAAMFLKWRPYMESYFNPKEKFKPNPKLDLNKLNDSFDDNLSSLNPETVEQKALQNHTESLYFMGYMYYKGINKTKDMEQAAQWFKKGVMRRNADCAYLLGIMYLKGEGVNLSLKRGFELLETAAAQNHKEAQVVVNRINKRYDRSKLNTIDFDYDLLEDIKPDDTPFYKRPLIVYFGSLIVLLFLAKIFTSGLSATSIILGVYLVVAMVVIAKKMLFKL